MQCVFKVFKAHFLCPLFPRCPLSISNLKCICTRAWAVVLHCTRILLHPDHEYSLNLSWLYMCDVICIILVVYSPSLLQAYLGLLELLAPPTGSAPSAGSVSISWDLQSALDRRAQTMPSSGHSQSCRLWTLGYVNFLCDGIDTGLVITVLWFDM